VSARVLASGTGFDGRDLRRAFGSTQRLQVDSAGGQEIVDTALELARGEVGVKVVAGARGLGKIAVARQGVGGKFVSVCGPGEYECGAAELLLG